jgi:hypothetical protein
LKQRLPESTSQQEKKKKKNPYLCPNLAMQKDFTPLVYSADGITGREAKNVENHIAYNI